MDWSHIVSFAMIAVVVEVSPGPNFALIAKSVATAGRIAAAANIPGFAIAFLLHGALSIYGVSAVLAGSPLLLTGVKLAGSLYLFHIGIQSLRPTRSVRSSNPRRRVVKRKKRLLGVHHGYSVDIILEDSSIALEHQHRSIVMSFWDGLITNILNPKITLFYYAVFPQIASRYEDTIMTSFLLVGIHVFVNAIWFFLVLMALDRMLRKATSDKLEKSLRRFSGFALIGFSLYFMSGVAADLYTIAGV